MGPKSFRYGDEWNIDVRILRDWDSSERDYLGFIEAPLQEIKLLRIWTEQVLEGAYPTTDDGFATLLMDLHRPTRRKAREWVVGRLKPGSRRWSGEPRHISLPHEHQSFQ